MAIALDASSKGFISGAAALTIAHTVGAGANRVLVVMAACVNSTNHLATATATYGGVSMGSPIVTPASGASDNYLYIWVLANPATGAANVVITPAAAAYVKAICSSWTGVDQTTPVSATAKYVSSFGASPVSLSIAASSGVAVDFLCHRAASKAIVKDGTQTLIGTLIAGSISTSGSSYKDGATEMQWTQPDPGTAHLAYAVIALAGASGGPATLAPADGAHAHAADNLTLSASGATNLVIADGAHAHAADNVVLAVGNALVLPALKNNAGTVLASETGATAFVYDVSTGALVVKKTGQTTNGSGVMTVVDASIVSGTTYRVVIVLASGAEGMDKVAA